MTSWPSRSVFSAGVLVSSLAVTTFGFGCDKAKAPESQPEAKVEAKAEAKAEPESAPDPDDEATTTETGGDNGSPERFAEIQSEPVDGDDDTYAVTKANAGEAGIGYRIEGLSKQGWSRSVGDGGVLVLSGPPGGPLGLEVRPYPADAASMALDEVFAAWTGTTPNAIVEPTQVSLAGAQRDAQAFRSGESLATTAHCLVRVPSDQPGKGGWWLRFYAGGSETQDPSCGSVLVHPAFVPIVKSFALVTE